jgi:Tetratricopeptide repeat/Bacterial SH3 domain
MWSSLRTQLMMVVTLILMLCSVQVYAGPLDDLAVEGDSAYKNGNYEEAIQVYNRILAAGYESGSLYYNLGNAYYKSGRLAESILYYKRAIRLMPQDKDVHYNLELAKSKTVDRIEAKPRLAVWNLLDSMRDFSSPRTTAIVALILASFAAIMFSIAMLIRNSLIKRIGRITSLVSAILFVAVLALVLLRVADDNGDPAGIVMVEKVTVHSAPDPTTMEVFSLHSGTHVTILKELDSWSEIRLDDGRQGWVISRSCEKI